MLKNLKNDNFIKYYFIDFFTDYTADLSIVCKDGHVLAHQMILGAHSKLLKQFFLSQHALEFAVVDWEAGNFIFQFLHYSKI